MTIASLPTLHDMGNAREILDEFLIEHEGEETPEIKELWERLDGDINEKIERWALWIQDRGGKAKEIKEEETRLALRRRALENACERSKAELKFQLERLGKTRLNGVLCSVAIQANSVPSVVCALDNEALKVAYASDSPVGQFVVEVPASYRLAHSAVVEAFKKGDAIPEEIIVEKGSHLRIR